MTKPAIEPASIHRALVLYLSGDLTPSSGTAVAEALGVAAADLPRGTRLVIDLRRVSTLSAAATRTVLAVAGGAAERGVLCRLVVDPTGAVARMLAAAGAETAVPLFADVAQALSDAADPVDGDRDQDVGMDRLLEHFDALTHSLLKITTVGAALRQIVEAAAVVIPGADLVSVTLRGPDGALFTPAETHPAATELDEVQYRSGHGPCVDAAAATGPGYVVSDDLGSEERWHDFTAAAVERGYRAVISTELARTGHEQLSGALNIYSRRVENLTATDRHAALLLATHASLALAHTGAVESAELYAAHLQRAVDSRDVIGQAKGILMNRQDISADEAFALLRKTSQGLNVKLVELARTLSDRHADLDAPGHSGGHNEPEG